MESFYIDCFADMKFSVLHLWSLRFQRSTSGIHWWLNLLWPCDAIYYGIVMPYIMALWCHILWHCDAIYYGIGSVNRLSSVQYQAITYSVDQWWFIVDLTLGNKIQWNFSQNIKVFFHVWNDICKMTSILFDSQLTHSLISKSKSSVTGY